MNTKNRLTILILVWALFSHSDVCVAIDWTSNRWNNGYTSGKKNRHVTVSSDKDVTITKDINFEAQITIKSGCTLTIIGGSGCTNSKTDYKWALWNKLPDTNNTNDVNDNDSCFCMFYVEPGAKLVLKNIDINGNAHNDWADGIAKGHFTQANKFKFGEDGNSEYRPLIYGGIYSCGDLELTDCRIHDFNCKTADTPEKRKQRTNYSAITISRVLLKSGTTSDNTNGMTTTITGCEIFENISYTGSAIFTHTCGKAAFNRINITNSNVYHNITRVLPDAAWGTANPNKWAGAIRTQGNSNAELNLKNTKIYENLANGECAGVFFNAQKITFDGCEIYKNESQVCGGGLRIETNCEFKNTLGKKTIVRNNKAATVGGGIHFYGYESTAYPTTQNWVYNLNDNLEVLDNYAGDRGGGIAFEFSEKMQIGDNSSITANIDGGIINGNTAGNYGGGIYAKNTTNKAKNYNITIYLNNGSIGKEGSPNKANSGAGIYIDNMPITSNKQGTINVSYNEADYRGGGIYSNNGNVEFTGNLNLTHNVANPNNSGIAAGGGLCIEGGSLTVNKANVSYNVSRDGGGIYAGGGCKVTITEGNISGNTSPTGWGAGVRVNDSEVELKNGDIHGNNCTHKAGGICLINSTMKITGSGTIKQNTSGEDGGGVFAQNSDFSMNNGEISGNTANSNGGGIYFVLNNAETTKKYLTFGGGSITGNKANTGSGGGVYISGYYSGGGVENAAVFNMEAGKVSGNEALRVPTESEVPDYNTRVKLGAGGGIYIQEGYATLGKAGSSETCEISGNECGQYGGGIYVTSSHGTSYDFASTLTMNNGVVKGNTAGNRGGGIYMKQSVLTMNGGDVIYNKATNNHAGGIDLNNTVFTMTGGNVSYNTAKNRGGGIYYNNVADVGLGDAWKDRDFKFEGGTISHNTAGEYGGGVCIYTGAHESTGTNGSLYKLSGGKIEYNTADNGGGVYYNGWDITTLDISNTNIEHNTAYVGGGLHAYNGNITYDNGLIRYNKAILRDGKKASDYDGRTMNNIGHCDRSNGDAIDTDLCGLGGGVFGNSVSITVGGTQFGIYKNTADVGADDILMNAGVENGSGGYLKSTINLPDVSKMTISDFNVPKAELFWAQDYIKHDSGYVNRPTNWCDPISYSTEDYIDRYRTKLYRFDPNIGKILPGRENNYANDYLCLALGYKLVRATITKSGLKENESAIFNVYRGEVSDPSVAEPYMQVLLTGTSKESVSRTMLLDPGAWTVVETDWSWAYSNDERIKSKTLTTIAPEGVSDLDAYNTFSFTNTPLTTAPHAEGVKENVFKETTE